MAFKRGIMKNQDEKFRKLNSLRKKGIELNSVWDFGKRETGFGSHLFHGNCIPQVVKQCVLRYTKKEDIVLDSMCGSGTTIDVCKSLNRRYRAFDINPKRDDIQKADSVSLPVKGNSISMVFIHLPYWSMVKYSNEAGDLSNMSLDKYFLKLHEIFLELRRVLKPDGHICVLNGDKIQDGRNIPLCFETYNILNKYFDYKDYAVKITKNATSTYNKGKVVLAELAFNNLLKPSHDVLLVFQKKQ
jgi:DNA modification methylase